MVIEGSIYHRIVTRPDCAVDIQRAHARRERMLWEPELDRWADDGGPAVDSWAEQSWRFLDPYIEMSRQVMRPGADFDYFF